MTAVAGGMSVARPQLIRAMNERVLLDHIRRFGPVSRPELARISGLSKPTVSMALANIERAGLVRMAGQRTGVAGPAATLYEVRPDAGFVVGLDVGRKYLRAAVADMAGVVRSRLTVRAKAVSALARVRDIHRLAMAVSCEAGIDSARVTWTVIGSPGVYDRRRGALALTGRPGWDSPTVLAALHDAFGDGLLIENDVDAAALAERAHGHGRGVGTFAFVSVGTGIGLGLVIDGRLHRGFHGVAGEISYLPFLEGHGGDVRDARRRGSLDASASAAAVVRAARRAGMSGASSAERVFAAAANGDPIAADVVAEEALLVAKAVCAVITVVDPELVVLGGGIGQAPGFLDAVVERLRAISPVVPTVLVSVLGADAVVEGCLAAGLDHAWQLLAGGASASGDAAARPAVHPAQGRAGVTG